MSLNKRILGFIWASPVTICGLLYVLVFCAFGYYTFYRKTQIALVFTTNNNKKPNWLMKIWSEREGHTIGNLIILNRDPVLKPRTLAHAEAHVEQCMKLGIFMPILYYVILASCKIVFKKSDPYFSHPFEIDARRIAGEVVDVEGLSDKLKILVKKSKR